MNKFFRALLILLSLALIIVPVSYASYLYLTTKGAVNNSFTKAEKEKSDLRDNPVDPAMDHVSILFLGIDDSPSRRKNGQDISEARTDAMILATFNRSEKQIRLVSIPRDTLSYIPSVKYYDKITHAHAEGGPESSMHTVEKIFNVPVDYYARVNMQAFVDIVDELGGVEFDVPFDIDEPSKTDKSRTKLKEGHQLINGEEALALARSRHIDTDLGRGKRQMQLIEAIVKKAKETNSLSKIDDLVEIVGNNAKHNMTFENITSLASYYGSNEVEFKRAQLKGTDYMYEGVYYYNPVFESVSRISKLLRKDLELPPVSEKSLLDYKVRLIYGDLIPLKKINLDKLEEKVKDYNKTGKLPKLNDPDKKESKNNNAAPVKESEPEAPAVNYNENNSTNTESSTNSNALNNSNSNSSTGSNNGTINPPNNSNNNRNVPAIETENNQQSNSAPAVNNVPAQNNNASYSNSSGLFPSDNAGETIPANQE